MEEWDCWYLAVLDVANCQPYKDNPFSELVESDHSTHILIWHFRFQSSHVRCTFGAGIFAVTQAGKNPICTTISSMISRAHTTASFGQSQQVNDSNISILSCHKDGSSKNNAMVCMIDAGNNMVRSSLWVRTRVNFIGSLDTCRSCCRWGHTNEGGIDA